MKNLPKARTADIIEQEAGNELLIYDLRTDKMFQLNETSKIIYKACGRLSFELLKCRYKFTDDFVHLIRRVGITGGLFYVSTAKAVLTQNFWK